MFLLLFFDVGFALRDGNDGLKECIQRVCRPALVVSSVCLPFMVWFLTSCLVRSAGLDSHAALVLMDYMQRLAQMKRTIICSIHQPRQAIWELFTKVEVLSEGCLMYTGPTEGALTWFGEKLRYEYNPTEDGTPCDWLLDLISVSFVGGSHQCAGMTKLSEVKEASARFCKEALPGVVSEDAFTVRVDETTGDALQKLSSSSQPFLLLILHSKLLKAYKPIRSFKSMLWLRVTPSTISAMRSTKDGFIKTGPKYSLVRLRCRAFWFARTVRVVRCCTNQGRGAYVPHIILESTSMLTVAVPHDICTKSCRRYRPPLDVFVNWCTGWDNLHQLECW